MHERTARQHGGIPRRTALAAGLGAGAGAAAALGATPGVASAASAAPAPPTAALAPLTAPGPDWFARPPRSVRPKFRWWWPDGLVDPDEVAREVDQIADAGFGGMEIAAVHHSLKDKSVLDTARHGWGGRPWRDGVEAALSRAARRGITIDLTLGPS